jgi:hypothetical protein
MIMNNNQQEMQQIHRTFMLKTLDHRLEVARAKGQINLIEQLEAEKRYYAN